MLVNIFKDVEYPTDKKDINHIIREYDKEIHNLFSRLELADCKFRKGKYIIWISTLLCIIYSFKLHWIPLSIKLLYIIPFIIFFIFYLRMYLKTKKEKSINLKLKMKTYDVMFICCFIYFGAFMLESLFIDERWNSSINIISRMILILLCIISSIIGRIRAPHKFIKNFQYSERKIVTPSSISVSIITLLVSISYFNKPYKLIVIGSYIILIIMCNLITYKIFEYSQYDKIQELKEQVNYKPKKNSKSR